MNAANRPIANKEIPVDSDKTVYDVIVVGGGMAGLTASAFAARAGLSVLLFEKESVVGGLINSFERNGFVWDAGIRALENSGIILPMLESLGISVDFVRSPVSLGIEDQVIPVETMANLADYQSLLEHFFPDNREEITEIIRDIKRVMKHMDVLYGIENPAFKDLRRDRAYLFNKLLPWLGKFLITIGKINRMSMPVEEHLESLCSSRPLIDIISQHFFKKTPAFFAMSYFSLYLDYIYPTGGTGELPKAVGAFCTASGVQIKTETRISAVHPMQHTVIDEDGGVHAYRRLVWAADLKTLYRSVNIEFLPEDGTRRKARDRANLMEACVGGDSVFSLYLAVDIEPEWFAAKSNGHFFYTPLCQGVGADIHSQLETLLTSPRRKDSVMLEDAKSWIERYVKSTTFEISIPVLKDTSLAPAGRTGLIISVLSDGVLWEMAKSCDWYEELKTFMEDCLIDSLDASIYPGLRDATIDRFSYTPITITEVVGTSEGAITGWAFTNPVVPAVHRMQQVGHSVLTALPDVLQAGQWSYSPSGLPIAILTGKLAADRVVKELRKRKRRIRGTQPSIRKNQSCPP